MSDEQLEREARAVGAVKKPWWFLLLVLALMIGTAFVSSLSTRQLGKRPEAASLAGLVAGLLLAISVLGHLPGKYRDARTGQYETFWSPQSQRVRVWCAIAAAAVWAVGMAIDQVLLDRAWLEGNHNPSMTASSFLGCMMRGWRGPRALASPEKVGSRGGGRADNRPEAE